jgi:hypothetical protein
LELINSMINGHSLIPEDQNQKKEYLLNVFLDLIDTNPIVNEDITLKEVEKLTGITCCFIVWSRTKKRIVSLGGENKLIDCIMASLCNIGIYDTYIINGEVFSSLENIECFPVLQTRLKDKKNVLYIANITNYKKSYSVGRNLGPLSSTEDELILQKSEYAKHRIENICVSLDGEVCKLYSFFSRGNSSEEEKNTLFILGNKQGDAFLKDEDTKQTAKDYLSSIYSQS